MEDPGDENDTSYERYAGQTKEQEKDKMFVVDDHHYSPPEESHAWEQQIERRAGIKASSKSSASSTSTSTSSISSKLLSLDDLSQKLKSTVDTIETQREELENSTNRRKADREHALVDSKTQRESLRDVGLACEFYQSTRRDLTLWVGALRDLQEKVQPIGAAFREMILTQAEDFDHEFRSWQDDCIATLHENNRLDRVLGRQPDYNYLTTSTTNEIIYDEFGRDVRSQYIRDRDFRFKKRTAYINKISVTTAVTSNDNDNDSDNDIDIEKSSAINSSIIMREDHNEEERSKTLHEALGAALEDLDQEYTSVTQLKNIFDSWFAAYFEDYQQCFATLSFGDLYAVLVQVEICKSTFFPDMLSGSSRLVSTSLSPLCSIMELDKCLLNNDHHQDQDEVNANKTKTDKITTENAGRLVRTVEKGVLPMLAEMLKNDKNNSFCLFLSSVKSSLISKLISDVTIRRPQQVQSNDNDNNSSSSSNSSSSNSLNMQLQNLVSTAIKNALDGVAIPILKKKNNNDESSSSLEAAGCSTKFVSVYLVEMLQQALCNMIIHWLPLVPLENSDSLSSDNDEAENGIHFVLNFINDKYLMLLSSLGNNDEASSWPKKAKTLFKPVWEALNKDSRNIVESPSLMLLTMPLRAAAHAYQLN